MDRFAYSLAGDALKDPSSFQPGGARGRHGLRGYRGATRPAPPRALNVEERVYTDW